jgi:Matrixin
MTITLFQDKNFRDRSMVVTQSIADLKDVSIGANPSSVRLTGPQPESILLYTKKGWDGDVHYVPGPAEVADLGSKEAGGELGFRNNVRAVRITPFRLRLNVNVIRNESGELPGQWTPGTEETRVRTIVNLINSFFGARGALLRLEIARVTLRTSNAKYNLLLTDQFRFPAAWRNPREVDVMVVNQFERDTRAGVGKYPHFGQTVMVAATIVNRSGEQQDLSPDEMALVMAHELGHYLGLQHNTANADPSNLMAPSFSDENGPLTLASLSLFPEQIEEMQQKLARVVARGRDRHS